MSDSPNVAANKKTHDDHQSRPKFPFFVKFKNYSEIFATLILSAIVITLEMRAHANHLASPTYSALQNTFASSSVLGGGLICLKNLPRKLHPLSVIAFTAIFAEIFQNQNLGILKNTFQCFEFSLMFFAASLQVLLTLFATDGKRSDRIFIISRAALLILGVAIAAIFTSDIVSLNPTYDAAMLNFDQHLAVRIPAILSKVFMGENSLGYLTLFVYRNIPAIIGGLDLILNNDFKGFSATSRFLIGGAIGYFLYKITPVAGPNFIISEYMNSSLASDVLYAQGTSIITDETPRNCMPSMHSTWAFMVMLNVVFIRSIFLRISFFILAALSVIGALTAGGHWFLDVVVAVPLAIAIDAVTRPFPVEVRWQIYGSAALSALFVAAWLYAITQTSFATISTLTAWALVLATTAIPLALLYVTGRTRRVAIATIDV